MSALLILTVVLPPGLALAIVSRTPAGTPALRLAPWAAVPGLAVALMPAEEPAVHLSWLLLGSTLGLDALARIFLFFTALLWTLAGIYAESYVEPGARRRYYFFHLLTLAGNLGLIVARDLPSFYLFFVLMTFSAYGLVAHDGTGKAVHAGRIYIVMAIGGEVALLSAFFLLAAGAPTLALTDMAAAAAAAPARDLLIALLLVGFGIKAGAVPLHMWLPLAHPVAPTPASAVLSGCLIKAGALGWLRFLPLGEAALPGWGAFMVAAGLAAAVVGVLIGITQRDAKTALAYSSISQMGLINVGIGAALIDPRAWSLVVVAGPLYAMHHGLAKGALFLGTGLAGWRPAPRWGRGLVAAGFIVPALALAGAPLTSGALAKLALKDAAATVPGPLAGWLALLLPVTAIGTTLLMARVIVLIGRAPLQAAPSAGIRGAWAGAVGAVLLALWTVPPVLGLELGAERIFSAYELWSAAWPVLAGLLLASLLARITRFTRRRFDVTVKPGDVLLPLERAGRLSRFRARRQVPVAPISGPTDFVASLASTWYGLFIESTPRDRLARLEVFLLRWEIAAIGLLVLAVVVMVAGWHG